MSAVLPYSSEVRIFRCYGNTIPIKEEVQSGSLFVEMAAILMNVYFLAFGMATLFLENEILLK